LAGKCGGARGWDRGIKGGWEEGADGVGYWKEWRGMGRGRGRWGGEMGRREEERVGESRRLDGVDGVEGDRGWYIMGEREKQRGGREGRVEEIMNR